MGIQQRDYIMREIDKIAKMLGYLIARILGLKPEIGIEEAFNETAVSMKEEIDFDLKAWLDVDDGAAMDQLMAMDFRYEHFDKLIDLLVAMGDKMPSDSALRHKIYERCAALDEFSSRQFGITSFENYYRRNKIEANL
ncbi:MAG: hypothetical protein J6C78_00365 [Muribaculaceae bacterium]|nr:hypothetical protein [Muribaculaceae bacterium]